MKLFPSEGPRQIRPNQLIADSESEEIHNLDPMERPGPGCKIWSMRWRGKEGNAFEGEEIDCQRSLTFSHEPCSEASSVNFMPVNIQFSMVFMAKSVSLKLRSHRNFCPENVPSRPRY